MIKNLACVPLEDDAESISRSLLMICKEETGPREGKAPAWGSTASEWQSQDQNPRF